MHGAWADDDDDDDDDADDDDDDDGGFWNVVCVKTRFCDSCFCVDKETLMMKLQYKPFICFNDGLLRFAYSNFGIVHVKCT